MDRKENAPVKGRGNCVADTRNSSAKKTPHQTRIAQCESLLKWLREHWQVSTLEARNDLGIMHPAARIQELRAAGYNIETYWQWETDTTGRQHKQGLYVLLSRKGGAL